MAKPTIVTRASKGSALTWTEGDTNLTNLRDATIGITDGTTSGTLDLNDTLTFTAGTNVTLSYNSTNKALTVNATGGGITDVVQDTTPQLGGNLDVNGQQIVSVSNGNIILAPNGTGIIRADKSIQIQTQGELRLADGDSSHYVGFKGPASIASNLIWTLPSADGTSGQVLSTNGSGTLSWATASGGGASAPYDAGSVSGTVTPNFSNGSTQIFTVTGAVKFAQPTNMTSGSSLKLIIKENATGNFDINFVAAYKFANGNALMTTTANAINTVVVYYDGTNYLVDNFPGYQATSPSSSVTLYGVAFPTTLQSGYRVTANSGWNLDGNKQFTISFWVYPTGSQSAGTVFAQTNTTQSSQFYFETTGISATFQTSTVTTDWTYSATFANALATNTWHHVVMSLDRISGENNLYVNGKKVDISQGSYRLEPNLNQYNSYTRSYFGSTYTNSNHDNTNRWAQLFIDSRFYNLNDPATLRKFYNDGPVDMGTDGSSSGLSQPRIFHYTTSGNYTTWFQNRGTAGGIWGTVTLTAVTGPSNVV